jgi:hypothetical protein
MVMTIDTRISFQDNTLTLDSNAINTLEVIGIKYGYDPIRFDMFTIGSNYLINLKTSTDAVVVNFRSYFNIGKKNEYRKFSTLLNVIWESTVVRLLGEMEEMLTHDKSVTIGTCVVNNQGITYRNFLILWDDLSYQINYNRLTINSKSNSDLWTNLYFIETYNVHLLCYFLDWKFKNNK